MEKVKYFDFIFIQLKVTVDINQHNYIERINNKFTLLIFVEINMLLVT